MVSIFPHLKPHLYLLRLRCHLVIYEKAYTKMAPQGCYNPTTVPKAQQRTSCDATFSAEGTFSLKNLVLSCC